MVTVKVAVSTEGALTYSRLASELTASINHCGKLEAKTLAEGGSSLHVDIVAVECSLYDLALVWPDRSQICQKSP